MDYIQGLSSPDFSLACFLNCKQKGSEMITMKIPSKTDIRFNGFIFSYSASFSFMHSIYFKKTTLLCY